MLAGLFTLVSFIGNETVAVAHSPSFDGWLDTATLYTMIPGLLNLLLIADVWDRVTQEESE